MLRRSSSHDGHRPALAALARITVLACGAGTLIGVAGVSQAAVFPRGAYPPEPPAVPSARTSRVLPVGTPAPPMTGTTVPGAPVCPMFPADNVWNTNISKLPVNSHSAAWLKSMDAAHTYLHPDFGPNTGGYPYGIPFKVVTSKHKLVHIKFAYSGQSNKGPYPFGSDTPIEGGKHAGGDRHAIMVNRQTCTLYELWDARYSSHPTAGSGAIWKLTSNALRPAGWTSADAAGLPVLPGLLDFSQVQAAVKAGRPISHAIRFTAQRTAGSYIWPARHEAGSGSSRTLPPMGARFRLKASFGVAKFCDSASTKYCKDAKAILVEMQHYGLILADNGSNWYFQGSAYPQWPNGLIELLKRIPARSFQAVSESCLRVHASSGEAEASPGCPIG